MLLYATIAENQHEQVDLLYILKESREHDNHAMTWQVFTTFV